MRVRENVRVVDESVVTPSLLRSTRQVRAALAATRLDVLLVSVGRVAATGRTTRQSEASQPDEWDERVTRECTQASSENTRRGGA